jgi:hypothetical protein
MKKNESPTSRSGKKDRKDGNLSTKIVRNADSEESRLLPNTGKEVKKNNDTAMWKRGGRVSE